MIYHNDTIAAVATAPGLGGIGIVRLSGPHSVEIARTLFHRPKSIPDHAYKAPPAAPVQFRHRQLHYGFLVDPDRHQVIDEVMVAFMQAPHSYTREDVIEIQSHAGSAVLQTVLGLVVDAGARLAEPGEFTRRAFLNGRIDLTQAEAVADLIGAKTQKALELATNHLTGGLRARVEDLRQQLQHAAGHLEAIIEFPEDVSDEADARAQFQRAAGAALEEIDLFLKAFQERHFYRDGIRISVVGRPNVGKSSLMNALLEKDRAIVTAMPGTTRDVVTDTFQVDGIPIQIADTAGMRASDDVIEQMGIQKTEESIAAAHLILFVIDLDVGLLPEDETIYAQLKSKNLLIVMNKSDRVDTPTEPPNWLTPSIPRVVVSAKYHRNIDALKQKVVDLITHGKATSSDETIVPNLRQKVAFEEAAAEISKALDAAQNAESEEFIVFHLQSALDSLGTITGETYTDDLLDIVFERFCIGK